MKLWFVVFLFFYTISFVLTSVLLHTQSIVSPVVEGEILAFESEVKAEQSTPTPTFTPIPTPKPKPTSTSIPTATPIPLPTSTPSPTPIPQPEISQEQIHGFVERFSGQYGVDPNVMRHLATCESGFNPSAVNGPYFGLFQFGTSAWTNARLELGENTDPALRLNAEEATQTASYLVSQGKGYLWPNCMP